MCVQRRLYLSYTDLRPFQLLKPVNRDTTGRSVYNRIMFVIYTTQAKRRCDDYSVLNWKGYEKRWSLPRRCHLDTRLQGLSKTTQKCRDQRGSNREPPRVSWNHKMKNSTSGEQMKTSAILHIKRTG